MTGRSLRISLPVLWPGTCSENFHKTSENSNRSNEMLERSVDHLFGRHLSHGKII